MVKYKSIVEKFQKKYPDALEVIVVKGSGKCLYHTKNWDVSGDMKSVIATWQSGGGQSVTVGGIRFSILQCAPERFIATNRHKKGHLIGASTPDGNTYVLAYVRAKAKGWFHMAYPAVARAAAMMQGVSPQASLNAKVEISTTKSRATNSLENTTEVNYQYNNYSPQQAYLDPVLKSEIEGFLFWIKTPTGLPAYIAQCLHQNDQEKISKLASIYNELYNICGN